MSQTTTRSRTVELPARIHRRVEARLPRSEFGSTDEYVTFVLEEVLSRVEDATEEENFQSIDRTEVEDRLRSLGYVSD
ncbi:hypothetical protein [Halegenticoccus soli]|uniref:hypothetical protein n=1 Tax=Halegenticoccus soli TaxID=1985678 RepID=UPI000C6ED859|nr:hypothetical protein [Halegenticoccus soli]